MFDKVIDVQNLSKKYGHFCALDRLSFDIAPGECLGLLGSNGAGKSTTIRILIGQLQPNGGQVRVMGFDPSLTPKRVHPFVGYIPDNQCLYDELTVEQNISIFAELYGRGAAHTQKIIERLALLDKTKDKVKNLSKGLKQRVLIARALVHEPQIVILDEPTSGLDPNSAESIYRILEDLKKEGATILLTTHLMNDVDRLCDRIVFINQGRKVEEGSPSQLKRKYSENKIEVTFELNGEIKRKTLLQDHTFMDHLSKIQQTGELISIHSHEVKLEDIFIQLVGGEH
jgi:ABC-2 type transport system ATP-binding protein